MAVRWRGLQKRRNTKSVTHLPYERGCSSTRLSFSELLGYDMSFGQDAGSYTASSVCRLPPACQARYMLSRNSIFERDNTTTIPVREYTQVEGPSVIFRRAEMATLNHL